MSKKPYVGNLRMLVGHYAGVDRVSLAFDPGTGRRGSSSVNEALDRTAIAGDRSRHL